MMSPVKIFIGYDSQQDEAYRVLKYSIETRSSMPVEITPLKLTELSTVFYRCPDPLQSTEFAFTRFLCPYLCDYRGWCLFMDCDMLNLDDISNLWGMRDEQYAIQVVKHEQQPHSKTKFMGNVQTKYARKNWSSLMLMNCARCSPLTKEFVNEASGLELHQFRWLPDALIGSLPAKWNHLVGINDRESEVSQYHYTNGGPWLKEYKTSPFAELWLDEYRQMVENDSL